MSEPISRPPRDVVYTLSNETWNDMVIREFARPPDRTLQHLMMSPSVRLLLVANPWRSAAGQLGRRFGKHRDARFPSTPDARLMRPVRLRRGDSANQRSLGNSYRLYGSLLRIAARRRGMSNPALITFNPLFAGFGDHRGFESVTYVARDDWAAYHGAPHLHDAFVESYARMRDNGVKVAAVSAPLLERIAPSAASVVVPNGVDPRIWTDPPTMPAMMAGLSRPVAVYTGTIDERISIGALVAIGGAMLKGTVLMIGPQDPATAREIIARVPNAVFLPSMKQSELAAFVAAADVCLLPHVRSTLTEAMSPLKVYEYLAAGRPVVATDLSPVRNVHNSIMLARSDEDFGPALRAAIDRGPMTGPQRLAFIEANSWDTRCSQTLDLALR